ncbi:hypothetical protein Bca52824_065848 [Brassica carinata]|uniref:Uncharacterized protein n=1 Tax=Brassica carinata TaxID=52824 RepID=A0A8X7QPB4_BRACI|nr:hypothetical protein Bca52824_065848 [Brassica carinata]
MTSRLFLYQVIHESEKQPNTFRHVLQEGSVYELSVFDVARSNPSFKFGDAPVSIRFTEHTVFVELT